MVGRDFLKKEQKFQIFLNRKSPFGIVCGCDRGAGWIKVVSLKNDQKRERKESQI